MKIKEKNQVIQIMRGLAIIIVLIHHSISRVQSGAILTSIDSIIICFHMPTFFIISGYLFQKSYDRYIEAGRRRFILLKVKHLIFPYIFWTVVLWLGVCVTCSISDNLRNFMTNIDFPPMSIKELLYGLFTYEVFYTEHLWFLYVLFIYFIINIFIEKKNVKYVLILALFGGISVSIIKFPNIIGRLLNWAIFFLLGREINNDFIEKRNNKKRIFAIVIFLVLAILRIIIINDTSVFL